MSLHLAQEKVNHEFAVRPAAKRSLFSLPNEIFLLGLAHGELAVYCYLKYLENRKTHQCWPSYRNIGKAVGMSENTVRKYVAMLEEHGLITTAYTIMRAKDGRPMNGHLMYTICPFHEVVDTHYRTQMEIWNCRTSGCTWRS